MHDSRTATGDAPASASHGSGLPGDLVASLAALGRSLHAAVDPRGFLADFCARVQRLLPHDRLVVTYLDDDGRTFTVFAEHAPVGPLVHERHYTTDFDPAGRYVVAEWALRPLFEGETMLVDDLRADPRFARMNAAERAVEEAGYRSVLLVPLRSRGRVIGGLAASCLRPGAYGEAHQAAAEQLADLVAPFIENTVLLQRERRRRERLRALEGLTRVLAGSLDVKGVFDRLAEAVRPALDFDIMGVALISSSGRDLEFLAEVDDAPVEPTPSRLPLEAFSFSKRVETGGPVVVHDAPAELDPRCAGDRLIIEGGGRSCLGVPLWMGERVGGALYFGKRRPWWFDDADVEVAGAIAAQVVLAVQHQRLAEDQRRLALAEGRARRLEERLASLRDALGERYGFDHVIGRSPALREALDLAARAAPAESTVLLTGESGTGKELVARAIHQASRRADGPFVAVSCAALADTLLESELFGHERGAFTGADRQRAGRFERAHGGTLFLDEIGEISAALQVKLLRVLQERQFERVGGTATLRADVRVIAATNRDLRAAVRAGHFREDLFYRLDVFPVHLPPLRERGDDVLLLAEHFVRELGARMGRSEAGLSREARDALLTYGWPGNIRELQNAIERALILCDGPLITGDDLGLGARGPAPGTAEPMSAAVPAGAPLATWERRLVLDALRQAQGNKSRAARLLGLTRAQLYTRLKRHGLEADVPGSRARA